MEGRTPQPPGKSPDPTACEGPALATDSTTLPACRKSPHLAAEGAEVLGVLGHLNLLDLLPQRGTIAGAVLADDPDLLRALRLGTGIHKYMSEGPFTGLRQAFVGSRPAPASKAPDTGAGAGPTAHTRATSVPLGLPTHHLDAPLCPKEGHCVEWGAVCPPRPPAVSTRAIRAARAARESGTRAHLAGPRSGSCARRSGGGLAQGLGGRWGRRSCRRYPENATYDFASFIGA